MTTQAKKTLYNEALDVLLKRANLTKKDIYETAEKRFAAKNLDLFTSDELRKYRPVIL